jgi:hypothetical protein
VSALIADAERVEDVVLPGETVLWTGAPPRGLRLRGTDAFLVPMTLMFFWFGVSRDTLLTRMFSHNDALLLVIEIVSVLSGGYLVAGRFALGAYSRAHTRYAVTDRAAYIARFGVRPALRRYSGTALNDIEADARADGVGTIRFGPSARTVFLAMHPELPKDWSAPLFTPEARAQRRKAFFGPRPHEPAGVRDEISWELLHEPTLLEFYHVADVRKVVNLIREARGNP